MPTVSAGELATTVPFLEELDAETSRPISSIMYWMIPQGTEVPDWWSPGRDKYLREFWPKVDPLKIAVTIFVNKAISVPFHVQPRDNNVKRHVQEAAVVEQIIKVQSGIFRGFDIEMSKFYQDFLTQDNGGFLYVMGYDSVSLPLSGAAQGLQHMDSRRCTRTGDPTWPVVFESEKGKRFKIHHSRVISMSNLPSPDMDMHGVGYCPVTCALDSATESRDVHRYNQEKFGSRPKRQILYVRKGATLEQLTLAVEHGDDKMDTEGLERFSRTLLLAPKNPNGELDLGMIDLASTPDGFNRIDVAIIDSTQVAAAFGLDPFDMLLNYGQGGSDAGSEVQERRSRGRGVATILSALRKELELKFLPSHLKASFDNVDDQQDEHQARIWSTRSEARQRDLTTGATTPTVERYRMLRNSEITEEEFGAMQLDDGILPNGLDVFSLFFSTDEIHARVLEPIISISENPLIAEDNDADAIIDAVFEVEKLAYEWYPKVQTAFVGQRIKQALAAAHKLRAFYEEEKMAEEAEMAAEEAMSAGMEPEMVMPQEEPVSSEDPTL